VFTVGVKLTISRVSSKLHFAGVTSSSQLKCTQENSLAWASRLSMYVWQAGCIHGTCSFYMSAKGDDDTEFGGGLMNKVSLPQLSPCGGCCPFLPSAHFDGAIWIL